MPEPNLPPLRVNLHTKEDTHDVISVPVILDKIPELPEQSRKHLIEKYKLRPETAIQLVNEPVLLEYFHELTTDTQKNAVKIANFLLNDLLTVLNKRKVDAEDCTITIKQMRELTDMLLKKEINLEVCRNVLDELIESCDSEDSPLTIVKDKGWEMNTDEDQIIQKCNEVIKNNPKLVKQYNDGKVKVFKALLGILAKDNHGKIDMAVASKKMEELLKDKK